MGWNGPSWDEGHQYATEGTGMRQRGWVWDGGGCSGTEGTGTG